MPILDFKEIPEAHIFSGEQDNFELFCQEVLRYIGLEIISVPDRGADGGKDIVCIERRTGVIGISEIKWIVSCKHKAHTGASVIIKDEENISDRIIQHSADGFMGFYSTVPSSSLNNRLNSLKNRYEIKIFNNEEIETKLLKSYEGENIAQRFFPISYSKWKVIHNGVKDISVNKDEPLPTEYSDTGITFENGTILKSTIFIRSLFYTNEYITRVLDYMLSRIESISDYWNQNFINIKEYKDLYKYKGGDLYDILYKTSAEMKDIRIKSNYTKNEFPLFENIIGINGIIKYKFSKEFINVNTDCSQGMNLFKLEDMLHMPNYRTKRLYEILNTYKNDSWKVSNEELQHILNIPYNNHSDIKSKVIDVSLKYIEHNYNIKIEYKSRYEGRNAFGFIFNIK